jgi:hypothetical protein
LLKGFNTMYRTTFTSLALLTASSAAFAGTTIVSAELKTATTVYLGPAVASNSDAQPVDVVAAIASGHTLQSQASAELSDADGRNANAFAVSQATWASANAGTISFSWGWTASSRGAETTFDTGGAINWSYTFVAAADGVFRADWSLFTPGTNNTTGLNRLNTSDNWTTPGGFGLGGAGDDPSGSGVSLVPLLAGETYTMSVSNVGYVGDPQGFDFRVANGEARIAWVIDYTPQIPEPGTWALLLAGLAGVGAVVRRRGR